MLEKQTILIVFNLTDIKFVQMSFFLPSEHLSFIQKYNVCKVFDLKKSHLLIVQSFIRKIISNIFV